MLHPHEWRSRNPDARSRGGRAGLHELSGSAPDQAAFDQPLERVNGEVKRRTDVVGIFPNGAAIRWLVGAILLEQNDECAVQRDSLFMQDTMASMSDDLLVSLPAVAI
ncbi:transposase [Microvirga arabica]|nr:transposase [Microvirga arabica]